MDILVDRLRVYNFRSLRNVEVELSSTTVLVGMNNSGKSSLLKALQLALGAEPRTIGPEDFFAASQGETEDQRILIDVRIVPVDKNAMREDEFSKSWTRTDFSANRITFDDEDREFVAVRTEIAFDAVRGEYRPTRQTMDVWPAFDGWHEQTVTAKVRLPRRFEHLLAFFMDAQRDILADLRSRSSYIGRLLAKVDIPDEAVKELEERLRALNVDIVGRSEILQHLHQALGKLKQTVPSFGDAVEIAPVSKSLRDITKGLNVEFQDSAAPAFPLDYHGMGTRSWTSLLAYQAYVSWLALQAEKDLNKPFHPVLLLEEPEAHLHPNAQRHLYTQLRASGGQQVVSTHSPYIAAQAELADLRFVRKEGASTLVGRMKLDDLTAKDRQKVRREVLHTRGELLFARAVVLFEGETEEQALPIFAHRYFKRECFELGALFVGVGGPNYVPFLRLCETLRLPWLIFSDAEERPKRQLERALEKLEVELSDERVVLLPTGQNVERYLVAEGFQEQLKAGVLDEMRPRLQGDQHEAAKETELAGWPDEVLLEKLKGGKTLLSPFWAERIASPSRENWPAKVLELMKKLAKQLGIEEHG